jgi:hypothetical protein
MALTQRVKRLEQFRRGTPCPICHGNWPFIVSHITDQEQPPAVKGCSECGEVNHIVVRYVTMPPIQEREPCLA